MREGYRLDHLFHSQNMVEYWEHEIKRYTDRVARKGTPTKQDALDLKRRLADYNRRLAAWQAKVIRYGGGPSFKRICYE